MSPEHLPSPEHTPSPQDDLGLTWVKGLKCPTCGGESLFVGKGGYVTCSYTPCPEPDYEKGLQSYVDTKVREARIDERQMPATVSLDINSSKEYTAGFNDAINQVVEVEERRLSELTQEQTR